MHVADPISKRAQLAEDGYLVVEDLFDPAIDFAPLYPEWQSILDDLVDRLVAEGALTNRYAELPFDQRLIAINAASGATDPQPFDISLPQKHIRHDTPLHLSTSIFSLLTHPRLLDVAEELLGSELVSNPIQHVRMKLPARTLRGAAAESYLAAKVPWHQDWGVLLPEADASTILSCWVAITDADEENGCLQVIPGSHRSDLLSHCPTDPQSSIPDRFLELDKACSVPMRAGSVLFFERRLVHGSLDNVTPDRIRISMDLRYQPAGQPTGRPDFPSFLARSASRPDAVLSDPSAWVELWLETRSRLAEDGVPKFTRWDADAPFCA